MNQILSFSRADRLSEIFDQIRLCTHMRRNNGDLELHAISIIFIILFRTSTHPKRTSLSFNLNVECLILSPIIYEPVLN